MSSCRATNAKPSPPTWERISLLRQALILASRGWRVFPLRVRDKIPATAHGVKDASCDLNQVSTWWKREPEANIGLACDGEFFVLDADDQAAVSFVLSLEMPQSTVWTPRGAHWYILKPNYPVKNSAKNLVHGIKLDIRSAGGYVVAPPSVHPSGGRYRWGTGDTMALPLWLDDLLRRKASKIPTETKERPHETAFAPSAPGGTSYGRGALQKELTRLYRATEGERNNQLCIAGFSLGQLVAGGQLEESTVEALLIEAGLDIGLDRKETIGTTTKAIARGKLEPRTPKDRK